MYLIGSYGIVGFYFERLRNFVSSHQSSEFMDTSQLSLDNYITVCESILEQLQSTQDPDLQDVQQNMVEIIASLREIQYYWLMNELRVEGAHVSVFVDRRPKTGSRGRPKISVRREVVEFLHDLRLSWTKISQMLGISRKTLYTIRQEHGLTESHNFTAISDVDLDDCVRRIKNRMPEAGQSMVNGALCAQGVHVPLLRMRESLLRVDPVCTALRWAAPISRRVYSVPASNYLWHIDGNHKLIRSVEL